MKNQWVFFVLTMLWAMTSLGCAADDESTSSAATEAGLEGDALSEDADEAAEEENDSDSPTNAEDEDGQSRTKDPADVADSSTEEGGDADECVTVEDCVEILPNRFELVVLSAQRSREISAGAPLTIERDDDKNPVIALREIADKTVQTAELDDALILSMQKQVESDEPEEDDMALLMSSDWTPEPQPPAKPDPEYVEEETRKAQVRASAASEGR